MTARYSDYSLRETEPVMLISEYIKKFNALKLANNIFI